MFRVPEPGERAQTVGRFREPVSLATDHPLGGWAKRVPVVGSHFSWGLGLSSPHGLYNFLLLENPFVVVVV